MTSGMNSVTLHWFNNFIEVSSFTNVTRLLTALKTSKIACTITTATEANAAISHVLSLPIGSTSLTVYYINAVGAIGSFEVTNTLLASATHAVEQIA
jgi:hypothetical protein